MIGDDGMNFDLGTFRANFIQVLSRALSKILFRYFRGLRARLNSAAFRPTGHPKGEMRNKMQMLMQRMRNNVEFNFSLLPIKFVTLSHLRAVMRLK